MSSSETEVKLFNRALAQIGDYRIVLESSVTVSSATAADPIVCTTSGAHNYSTGNLLLLRGFNELTQVNGRVFRITVLTSTTFELDDEDGSAGVAETTGGTAEKLEDLRQAIECFGAWEYVRPKVLEEHAWNDATVYYELARLDTAVDITGVTQANPAVVSATAHGLVAGDRLFISGVLGMVELNGRFFTVGTVSDANSFQLTGENSTNYAAYSSAGTLQKALQPLKPPHGFDHRYSLPSGVLRVLNLAEEGREEEPWERVGQEFYTDEGITVPIRYTKDLNDPALYSKSLFMAFASSLAWEVVPVLTNSRARIEEVRKRAEESIKRAKKNDGQEQSTSQLRESEFVTARWEA